MNDFIKLTKTELRQNTGIAVLTFLFIFFSRFITFVSKFNNAMDNVKADFVDMDYVADTAAKNIGSENIFHIAAVILLAGIFGLIVCRYLHRRKTVDFYYSLPYKRTTVFAAKYSSFIIIFALCYGFNLLLMLMACKGISIRAFTVEVVISGLKGLFNGIFGFTLIYSSVVLAGLLTGGILAHIALGSLFMYIVPLTYFLIYSWSDTFFPTSLTSSWSEIYYFISPISWFCSTSEGKVAGIISMAVISAVITIINFVICKKRKAESAGSVLIFYGEPLRLFLSLVIAAGGGFTARLFFGYRDISFAVGFFAALIISSVIIEIIFSADFGAALKHKRWLGASVLTGAVIIIYSFSGLYDSYLPKASLIKEAAFYIDEIHGDELITTKEDKNYLAKSASDSFMKEYSGETVFSSIPDVNTYKENEDYTDYVFKNMKITDGELAEKVLSACVKRYREKKRSLFKQCGKHKRKM
ncbi:MAG: ABC transporter permease [Clostridiales bacterium]|nr:ABC transporter permease [Clostridiales bacterium]